METRQAETEAGTTTYYLRSSVLGGQVVAEVDAAGLKRKGEAHLGGAKLAEQDAGIGPGALRWRHADAARGSYLETDTNRIVTRRELDPLGADVGTADPFVIYGGSYGQLMGSESLYGERGNPFNLGSGCALDGVAVSCSFQRQQMEAGAAANETVMRHPNGRWEVIQDLFRDEGLGLLSTYTYGAGRGGEPESKKLFFYRPQDSGKPSMDPAKSSGTCLTPNKLINDPSTRKLLDDLWDKTMRSTEENGVGFFYEPATGTMHSRVYSEGKTVRLGNKTQYAPVEKQMPEIGPETREFLRQFRENGQRIVFAAFFHTHPNFTSGSSGIGRPSGPDQQFQYDYKIPLGIIRTGDGYFFYDSEGRPFGTDDARANQCIQYRPSQIR